MRSNKTNPVHRGLIAENRFRKLFTESVKASDMDDILSHFDFSVRYDVKKIRSTDEFGESNYHWIETVNVIGEPGWLYGDAHFFAFEIKNYWIVVDRLDLIAMVERVVTNPVISKEKIPYRIYNREGREDRIIMVPTIDLCFIGIMVEK